MFFQFVILVNMIAKFVRISTKRASQSLYIQIVEEMVCQRHRCLFRITFQILTRQRFEFFGMALAGGRRRPASYKADEQVFHPEIMKAFVV